MPPILLRSAVDSTKPIGQLYWALFIVIQSDFCFLFILFTCLSELDSNNKRADEKIYREYYITSGLKDIFHCTAHPPIKPRSIFSKLKDVMLLCIIERREVASENIIMLH